MEPSANELLTVIGIVLVAIILVSALIALIVLLVTGRLSILLANRRAYHWSINTTTAKSRIAFLPN